ncbi:MAG: RNA methyltransferase [Bdellovibrionaceae bacterium]|nr:RNA methyltransferase [Pseudobdellovibrionaceae bacterium]
MGSDSLTQLQCVLAGKCSGCSWIDIPYWRQAEQKKSALRSQWLLAHQHQDPTTCELPPVEFCAIAPGGLRDRADLSIQRTNGRSALGLFATDAHHIVDMRDCAQMSASLQDLLQAFRAVDIPVERGSVRLRVSPRGEFGVWLDLANVDVKRLLDERNTLDALRAFSAVEIGQRRKTLIEHDGRLKLGEPQLKPWFETYLGDNAVPAEIWTTIGGFTQPGFTANRALIQAARGMWKDLSAGRAAEFGAGSGNFTLPLAADGFEVDAYELDALACEGLRRGLEATDLHGVLNTALRERVTIHQGDFQRSQKQARLEGLRLLFVDPPRSGLKEFLNPLIALNPADRPEHIVYVSCFAESFCLDAARLNALGYRATRVMLVDQFPQSPHFEIVSRFDRISRGRI